MLFRLLIISLLFCACSAQRMTQTDLYFGQLTLRGDTITQQQWYAFAQQYISKVLPNGCTVINATGYWYDTSQHRLTAEPSRLVTSVNKMSPLLSKQIDSLRNWYKTLYQQQSVLRVDKKVKMKLY
jgi:nitrate reductase alpha subunit